MARASPDIRAGEAGTNQTMLSFRAKSRERAASERLYDCAVAAARRPALYAELGVADTLQGRFEMLALHLFAVLHPLMHDPGDDPELARRVAERFVEDMDAAFREIGVGDLSVPKRMTDLYRSFGGRMTAYKAGLERGRPALAAAIARNVFLAETADRRAEALADHLIAAVAAIKAAGAARQRQGEIAFPELSLSVRQEATS
jgi:cytochrome b pre-mRNA-processing protein 3